MSKFRSLLRKKKPPQVEETQTISPKLPPRARSDSNEKRRINTSKVFLSNVQAVLGPQDLAPTAFLSSPSRIPFDNESRPPVHSTLPTIGSTINSVVAQMLQKEQGGSLFLDLQVKLKDLCASTKDIKPNKVIALLMNLTPYTIDPQVVHTHLLPLILQNDMDKKLLRYAYYIISRTPVDVGTTSSLKALNSNLNHQFLMRRIIALKTVSKLTHGANIDFFLDKLFRMIQDHSFAGQEQKSSRKLFSSGKKYLGQAHAHQTLFSALINTIPFPHIPKHISIIITGLDSPSEVAKRHSLHLIQSAIHIYNQSVSVSTVEKILGVKTSDSLTQWHQIRLLGSCAAIHKGISSSIVNSMMEHVLSPSHSIFQVSALNLARISWKNLSRRIKLPVTAEISQDSIPQKSIFFYLVRRTCHILLYSTVTPIIISYFKFLSNLAQIFWAYIALFRAGKSTKRLSISRSCPLDIFLPLALEFTQHPLHSIRSHAMATAIWISYFSDHQYHAVMESLKQGKINKLVLQSFENTNRLNDQFKQLCSRVSTLEYGKNTFRPISEAILGRASIDWTFGPMALTLVNHFFQYPTLVEENFFTRFCHAIFFAKSSNASNNLLIGHAVGILCYQVLTFDFDTHSTSSFHNLLLQIFEFLGFRMHLVLPDEDRLLHALVTRLEELVFIGVEKEAAILCLGRMAMVFPNPRCSSRILLFFQQISDSLEPLYLNTVISICHVIEHKLQICNHYTENLENDSDEFALELFRLNQYLNSEISSFVPIQESYTVLGRSAKAILGKGYHLYKSLGSA